MISTGFASFLVPTATDSVHVLSPAAVMVTVVGAVGVLAFRDGLVVAGAGADSAAPGGASVAGRAFRDGRAEFDSSTSVFDDDVGCGFGGAGSGVRRRTAAVAVSLRNVRGPNVLGEGNGSSEGQLVTEASTPTRTSSVKARETPIADHAYAGVTIAALLCATSAATFLTLFP